MSSACAPSEGQALPLHSPLLVRPTRRSVCRESAPRVPTLAPKASTRSTMRMKTATRIINPCLPIISAPSIAPRRRSALAWTASGRTSPLRSRRPVIRRRQGPAVVDPAPAAMAWMRTLNTASRLRRGVRRRGR